MNKIKRALLLVALTLGLGAAETVANNEIFPATGEARKAMDWKDGYFIINGKPTFLAAGEIHYARIPRELWRDRLWRIRQMGFNCIQLYVFWNAHEPKEGQWDFSDNLDLDAFLSLTQEMGMYAIVRCGPYSCAEWEHGGFPGWLTVKPGMVVRDALEPYTKYADRHLAKIYEIIARHQIHRGGNVIMAQLENEYPRGWGTDPHPHLMHLYEKARKAGLEIPLFFSGLHHAADPSGETPYKVGSSPWYTTEFWSGWIGKWGNMDPGMLNEKIRGTWKIIAFGGAGSSYYVVHGGSNFGYSNGSDNNDASYDYAAPIGEAGQFHNLYGPARRAALFTQTFSDILTSSANAPEAATSAAGSRVTVRKSPGGSIVFADNFQIPGGDKAAQHIAPTASAYQTEMPSPGKKMVKTRIQVAGAGDFPKGGDLVIQPEDIRTVLLNIPWTRNCSFESISANVLMRHMIGDVDTWVCYGNGGDYGEITLKRSGDSKSPSSFSFNFPADNSVQEISIESGDGPKARFLVMNTALADKTWWVKDRLVVGASFVRENGGIEMPPEGGTWAVYQASGKTTGSLPKIAAEALPALSQWEWRDAARERMPDYDDSKWVKTQNPQPMETYDSYQNRYGWYRTTLQGGADAPVSMRFTGSSGSLTAFLNGQPADLKSLSLKPGDNTLAVLVKAQPRPKFYNVMDASGLVAAQGVWGPTIFGKEPFQTIREWKVLYSGSRQDNPDYKAVSFNDQSWETLRQEADKNYIEKPDVWLRGSIEIPSDIKSTVTYLPSRSEVKISLFVNGEAVPLAMKHGCGLDITPFLKPGRNSIALHLMLNKRGKPWIRPAMEFWRGDAREWRFRPSLENLEETAVIGRVLNWEKFSGGKWESGTPAEELPRLWKTTFTYQRKTWETVGLVTEGLKPGHVWLNGHNLGESPQKVPMYMPECWLKDGENVLVVLDLKGGKPEKLRLERYESRQVSSSAVAR